MRRSILFLGTGASRGQSRRGYGSPGSVLYAAPAAGPGVPGAISAVTMPKCPVTMPKRPTTIARNARSRWTETRGHDAEMAGHDGPKYALNAEQRFQGAAAVSIGD
ncbi:MAG: hypothetical protein KJ044_14595, partial [Planctomycetes bacterium]|nr:hypothetical protein [Planctomycetota bacterium]